MRNKIRFIALVAIAFVAIVSAFMLPPVVRERVASARRRAYAAVRQRQEEERNLYLMGQLPEYFAGSYYYRRWTPEWHDVPYQLVILVVEGGYLAAGELGIFGEADIREDVGYIDYRGVRGRRGVEFTYAQLLETQAAVAAAMEARTGCVYVRYMSGPFIRVASNRLVIEVIGNYIPMEFSYAADWFRRYVYASEMIEFRQVFYLCLGGGRGSYWPAGIFSLFLAVIAAAVVHFAIEGYRGKRGDRV